MHSPWPLYSPPEPRRVTLSIMRALGFCLLAACGSGGGFPDAREIDARPPTGTFTLDWALTDLGNNHITCDQVGAQSVTVLAHNVAAEGGLTQVFVCSTLMGTSQGLDPAVYDFDLQLAAASGILQAPPGQHSITIASGQNTPLASIVFKLDATGGVALNVSTGRSTNCGTTAPANGAITQETITLTHNSDGSCEPITLTIGASTLTPTAASGSYTINCTTPVVTTCIERDSSLTATGVKSDNYTIHVAGKQGVAGASGVCWTNNDSIVIPPLGGTLTRQLNLGFATGNSSCM